MPTPYASGLWFVDFEYRQPPGERPHVWCMSAREYHTGQEIRLWRDDLMRLHRAPFDTENAIMCSYVIEAEIGCFKSLGWSLPRRALDLYIEFRWLVNGHRPASGFGLLGALAYFGLSHISVKEKQDLRDEAQSRIDWPPGRRLDLMNYCASDTAGLAALFPRMADKIDWPRAFHRARFSLAVTRPTHIGIPIDTECLARIREHTPALRHRLIADVDQHFGVYDGNEFRLARMELLLADRRVMWPRKRSGALDMEAVTWRDMAVLHPWLNPLRELRATLAQMRWNGPAVGSDGRNRFTAWAFSTKTSRCAPKAKDNVFGLACWTRSLVRPIDGTALLYFDYSAQEFGLAGVLANDPQMLSDYRNGDPYLIFAVRAQLAPSNATKRSHSVVRARCKIATLAGNYGQGARGLSLRLGIDEIYARDLIQRVAAAYPRHRQWMDRTVDHAMIFGRMDSPFGWRLWITADTKVGTILNWKLQTLGAELLRIATIVTVEEGWDVVATLHDALLVQVPVELVGIAKARITEIMRHAADVVTQGRLDLRADVTEILPGQRFVDERGVDMWRRVMALLDWQEGVACVK